MPNSGQRAVKINFPHSSKVAVMSSRLAQILLFFIFRCCPVWIMICILPVAAEAENIKVERPRMISAGMELVRQGISGNMCALTFDDGPGPYTSRLLDILKEYGVKATFFVVGTQVKRRPELIRRMLEEGHEVGNHSYSHHTLRRMPAAEQHADLLKLDTLLRELGVNPRFVRPPYGSYDHNTVNAVQEMDGHLIMWSVDSRDWRKNDSLQNLNGAQMMYRGAPLRGVFLFHDTHRPTVENMPQILATLAATDCSFVTLSEYIDGPKQLAGISQISTQTPAKTSDQPKAEHVPAKTDPTIDKSGLTLASVSPAASIVSVISSAPQAPLPVWSGHAQPSLFDPVLEPFRSLFNASHPPKPEQRAALLDR